MALVLTGCTDVTALARDPLPHAGADRYRGSRKVRIVHSKHVAVHLAVTLSDQQELHVITWAWATVYVVGQTGVGLMGMPGFPWRVVAIHAEAKEPLRQRQTGMAPDQVAARAAVRAARRTQGRLSRAPQES